VNGRPARVAVVLIYAVVVVWVALHHEPWRDEVVPLSIARNAHSLGELEAPLRFEGHPILWYLLLWCGYRLVGSVAVLKAASLGCAIGGIALLNTGPLPWWIRVPFTFSFFPLYQYSVVSRGYSLELLLLFVFCTLFPRRREHPVLLALVLAALANTEAFGLVIAVAAAGMLTVEASMDHRERRAAVSPLAIAVFLAGLALAADIASPAAGHPLTGFRTGGTAPIAAAIGKAVVHPAGHAGQFAVVPAASAWIWAYFVYLASRPPVLAFAAIGLIGIEAFFNFVYGPGAPWHVGNLVLVLVATMWLDASGSSAEISTPFAGARRWLGRLLAAGALAMLLGQTALAYRYAAADVAYDYSANRRLAELLRSDPTLAGAIVTGEPDTPLWSLSYYADNRIYLARQHVFRAWGAAGPERSTEYDLQSLLEAARRIHADCGCPVVITLGWQLGTLGTFANFAGTQFEERFTITAAAREQFLAATTLVARLGPTLTDENYDVYVLR